jgi:mono/diheme cytochrome c family protein
MLIERMENRILVGVVAFVAIMVLVGWVAINENARMASFARQFEARSVERGAALFAANCTSCHGTGGYGITNIAPGLNNPAFFGFDYIADTRAQMDEINRVNGDLDLEKTELADELAAGTADETRQAAIATRLGEIAVIQEENAARLVDLEAVKLAFADSIVPAIDNGYTLDEPTRLGTLGWGGTLNSFIVTTLIHGRPTSESYWPQPMVAWSQTAGASLRDDQIQDIANYIQNWDKGSDWTVEDLLAVNQFPRIPGEGGAVAPTAPPVGADVEAAVTQIAALTGDAARGQQLYEGREPSQVGERLSCSGCHYGGAAGPAYEGIWERIVNERLADPALAGQTPEHYIVESILAPGNYASPGWTAGAMPANYATVISAQDLADLVEYMKATDPNYVAPEPAMAEEGA